MIDNWKNDDELFALMKTKLFSAVIGDIMDQDGYFHQFLPPSIQPLKDDMIVAGRAMTVLEADSFDEVSGSGNNPSLAKPFGLMLEALDDLKKNEVYVCTGASPSYALWGELMTTRAKKLGAAGVVLNGYTRDSQGIISQGFPTFSMGRYAQDQGPRGKVIDFRTTIEMDGTQIRTGDIVYGDTEGVCIIPREIERDIILRAIEKAEGEKMVQKAIEQGMSACEAFKKYAIM
jgi:regulator of RNase E activity RraA